MTLPQRARLGQLEHEGWQLLFVRGESSQVFVTHETLGHATLARDGRMIRVRTLPARQEDRGDAADPGTMPDDADSAADDSAG